MMSDKATMRTTRPNPENLSWPRPGPETAEVDMWIGLPRAEWDGSVEKWDCEQGRVPSADEDFSEPRTSEVGRGSADKVSHEK